MYKLLLILKLLCTAFIWIAYYNSLFVQNETFIHIVINFCCCLKIHNKNSHLKCNNSSIQRPKYYFKTKFKPFVIIDQYRMNKTKKRNHSNRIEVRNFKNSSIFLDSRHSEFGNQFDQSEDEEPEEENPDQKS